MFAKTYSAKLDLDDFYILFLKKIFFRIFKIRTSFFNIKFIEITYKYTITIKIDKIFIYNFSVL